MRRRLGLEFEKDRRRWVPFDPIQLMGIGVNRMISLPFGDGDG